MKLKQLNRLLTEYVAERQPSLAAQLELSLALKAMEKCQDGLLESFMAWLIERKDKQNGQKRIERSANNAPVQ